MQSISKYAAGLCFVVTAALCLATPAQASTAVSFNQVINEPSFEIVSKQECTESIAQFFSHKSCICRELDKKNVSVNYCKL